MAVVYSVDLAVSDVLVDAIEVFVRFDVVNEADVVAVVVVFEAVVEDQDAVAVLVVIAPKDVVSDVAIDVEDLDLDVVYVDWVVNVVLDVVLVVLAVREDLDVVAVLLAVVLVDSQEFDVVSNVRFALFAVFVDVSTLADGVGVYFVVTLAVFDVVLSVNAVAFIANVVVLEEKYDVDVAVDVQDDAFAVSSAKEDYRSALGVDGERLPSSRNVLISELESDIFALNNVASACYSELKRFGSQ